MNFSKFCIRDGTYDQILLATSVGSLLTGKHLVRVFAQFSLSDPNTGELFLEDIARFDIRGGWVNCQRDITIRDYIMSRIIDRLFLFRGDNTCPVHNGRFMFLTQDYSNQLIISGNDVVINIVDAVAVTLVK